MADDRSLDEFFGDAESGERDDDPGNGAAVDSPDALDSAGDEVAEVDGSSPPASEPTPEPDPDVESMAETFAWSGTGGECTRCGEVAEERWRDGNDLVCGDCKAW